jgi:G3E family GTPase
MTEELLSTIDTLISPNKDRPLSSSSTSLSRSFDHIFIEASGISEPRGVRDAFQDAEVSGHPVLEQVKLSNMITVVDSALFLKLFETNEVIGNRPDLISVQIPGNL